MFPCDRRRRKRETISPYDSFPFCSLSLTITRILGEFIASGLKLIISARHPKYKRNYMMVFCPGPNRYNYLQRRKKKITGRRLWACWFVRIKGMRMRGEPAVNTVAQWAGIDYIGEVC